MPNEILTLKIHDIARGGSGVAREESGRVVFVPYTAPGDEVRARVLSAKKNYAQAELLEVLAPSPQRQTPPCPVFGKCGGCQWQHLPYELQWKTKVQGVLQALARMKVTPPGQIAELPAERIWEYRNRVQLRGFKNELGFMATGTHDRVAVDRCAIARPEINAVWEEVRQEGARLGQPYKVEVEVLDDGTVRQSWNSPHGAEGFRQVHDEQNAKLQGWVAQKLTPGGRLLDLFGGAGNLSLGLRSTMKQIDCVDTGVSQEGESSGHYLFHREPVSGWLVKKASLQPRPHYDSAILDPPREGLGADHDRIADSLEALGVREIAAIGCDPDSWAKDLAKFIALGWRLEAMTVLDLFPQTIHVESLALLRR